MTKNESRLLYLLFLVIIGVCFFFSKGYWSDRKELTISRINKYEKQIQELTNSTANTATTTNIQYLRYATVEEANFFILEELKNSDIEPTRYEITGKGDKQKIGITFTTTLDKFVSFLYRDIESIIPYTITSFTAKPIGSNQVYVDLLLEPIYSSPEQSIKNMNRNSLRRSFKYTDPQFEPVAEDTQFITEDTVLDGNGLFHFIGKITGQDGVVYVLLKKNNGNRLLKIPLENNESNVITFEFENAIYSFKLE